MNDIETELCPRCHNWPCSCAADEIAAEIDFDHDIYDEPARNHAGELRHG